MSETPRTDACWDDESCNILIHARQLERELADVTKDRDELAKAIRKHKETLPFMLDCCDEDLYKTLEEIVKGGEL